MLININKNAKMSATFHKYPEARQGPAEPYKREDVSLPVLRGPPLALGATLYVYYVVAATELNQDEI